MAQTLVSLNFGYSDSLVMDSGDAVKLLELVAKARTATRRSYGEVPEYVISSGSPVTITTVTKEVFYSEKEWEDKEAFKQAVAEESAA